MIGRTVLKTVRRNDLKVLAEIAEPEPCRIQEMRAEIGQDARALVAPGRIAYEPRSAVVSGRDGLDHIRRAVADLPRVLRPGGAVLFECDPPQAPAIAALLRPRGETVVVKDLAGHDRVVIGRPIIAT